MVELRVELLHADATGRVVRVTAHEGERLLGSCLGEAPEAEQAEDRAAARLLARLGLAAPGRAPQASVAQAAAPAGDASRARGPTPGLARRDPAPSTRRGTDPASQGGAPLAPSANGSAPAAASATGQTLAPAPGGVTAQMEIVPSVNQPHGSPAGSSPAPVPAPVDNPPLPAPPTLELEPESGPQAPAPDPDDWSQELAGLELQLRRLGWGREQEAVFLERAFGHPSRSRLTTYGDLMAYLRALEGLEAGADPARATVPLRRRDLLRVGDELMVSLGWSADQGRRFLEEHLGQSSRQRLSDAELLRFNLMLEAELIQLEPAAAESAPDPA
ncbi:MAG: hypothetical protein VKI42_04580 [Synechococcaceae cyanobacterium]|nr:hypothetical protein [Synechococcaceae cyanobacterium]